MQKKSWILLPLFILLIGVVSAQFGGFSISDFFSEINPNDLFLVLIFLVSLALLTISLSRAFEKNRTVGVVIAFLVSIGITYGINLINFDIEELFFDIGVSSEALFIVIPLLLIFAVAMFSKKFGFRWILIALGVFLLLAAFTEIIYETGVALILGFILLAIGFFLLLFKKKRIEPDQGRRSDRRDQDRRRR